MSRALDAVVLKALAKDPANRFASADEFLAALDAAETDPSGAALGDTAAHEAVAVAAGTPPPAPSEPPERRGFFTPARLVALALLLLLVSGVIAYALTRPESVLVPTVIGVDQTRAETILADAGFEVAVKSVPSDNAPGTVLEQDRNSGLGGRRGLDGDDHRLRPDRPRSCCRRSPGNGPNRHEARSRTRGLTSRRTAGRPAR